MWSRGSKQDKAPKVQGQYLHSKPSKEANAGTRMFGKGESSTISLRAIRNSLKDARLPSWPTILREKSFDLAVVVTERLTELSDNGGGFSIRTKYRPSVPQTPDVGVGRGVIDW